MKRFSLTILLLLLSLFSSTTFAWNQSMQIGYGYSHDPNHTKYNNSGVLLTSDYYSIRRTPYTYWSLTAALGQWHSTAPKNQNLTTVATSLALRFYPITVLHQYPAYILASAGPAYLSSRKFGLNTQGSNFSIQSNAGLGIEFNQFDLNLRWVHYSNAGLAKPNEGFNVLYLLSLGYLF